MTENSKDKHAAVNLHGPIIGSGSTGALSDLFYDREGLPLKGDALVVSPAWLGAFSLDDLATGLLKIGVVDGDLAVEIGTGLEWPLGSADLPSNSGTVLLIRRPHEYNWHAAGGGTSNRPLVLET